MKQPSAVLRVGDRLRLTAPLCKAILGAVRAGQDHLRVAVIDYGKGPDGTAEITLELWAGGAVQEEDGHG